MTNQELVDTYERQTVLISAMAQVLVQSFEDGRFTSPEKEVYDLLKTIRELINKRESAFKEIFYPIS